MTRTLARDRAAIAAMPHLDVLLSKIRKLPEARSILLRRRFAPIRLAYYAELWRGTAAAVGAVAQRMEDGRFSVTRAGRSVVLGAKDVRLDRASEAYLANKSNTHALFRRHGLPVPEHCVFELHELERAEEFLRDCGGAVVVKPADGTGSGRGVTTGIRSVEQLRSAAHYAARYNRHLLAEQQISGQSHRILFLDGTYVDAIRKESPSVIGDGVSTIKELVRQENETRLRGAPVTALNPLVIDADARNTLAEAGLTPLSRPAPGTTVTVKAASNENAAAQNHNVRDMVHPETIRQCTDLVRDLGLRFCGIDVMAREISRPLEENGGAYLEVNTPPGIHHHYLVSEPEKAVPVAELLLESLFEAPGSE